MTTTIKEDHSKSPVHGRVQIKNPVTKQWVKIDTRTGRIVDVKKTPGPFKGIKQK